MPDKLKEYLNAFLDSKNDGYKDMILENLLVESEEFALIEFYEFRNDFQLYVKEHCPGYDSDFCGSPRRKHEDFCWRCLEAQDTKHAELWRR